MRHRKKVRKLGLPKDHRTALLRNLASSLVISGQVKTTLVRARELSVKFDRLMRIMQTKEKREAIRLLPRFLSPGTLGVAMGKKLDGLKTKYNGRSSGFTRITPLGLRKGDNALLVKIELL